MRIRWATKSSNRVGLTSAGIRCTINPNYIHRFRLVGRGRDGTLELIRQRRKRHDSPPALRLFVHDGAMWVFSTINLGEGLWASPDLVIKCLEALGEYGLSSIKWLGEWAEHKEPPKYKAPIGAVTREEAGALEPRIRAWKLDHMAASSQQMVAFLQQVP